MDDKLMYIPNDEYDGWNVWTLNLMNDPKEGGEVGLFNIMVHKVL